MNFFSLRSDAVPYFFAALISAGAFIFVQFFTPLLKESIPFLGVKYSVSLNSTVNQNLFVTVENLSLQLKFSKIILIITSPSNCSFKRSNTTVVDQSGNINYSVNLSNQSQMSDYVREVRIPKIDLQPSQFMKFGLLYSCKEIASLKYFDDSNIKVSTKSHSGKVIKFVYSPIFIFILKYRYQILFSLMVFLFLASTLILRAVKNSKPKEP